MRTSYILLDIRLNPNQWDKVNGKVINHPQRASLNAHIMRLRNEAEIALLDLSRSTNFKFMTSIEVRDAISSILFPSVEESVDSDNISDGDPNSITKLFERFMSLKDGRTYEMYAATLRRLKAFCGDLDSLHFEDIKPEWLHSFDKFMEKTAPSANARAIHMRNFRAVNNFAIDNEITQAYPFRRYKIKTVQTRKRNFTAAQLRKIFSAPCEEWQVKYRDLFTLTFMLIGINCKDLCHLTDLHNGRIEYIRAKTKKPYSIKVEPEAQEIIDRYPGQKYLLNYMDTYSNYRYFYLNLMKGLKGVKETLNKKGCDIAELTTYWARHSWATIASYLDIPMEVISRALGHTVQTVTNVYIQFDDSKVDDANRKVLDYVLYGIDYRKVKPAKMIKRKIRDTFTTNSDSPTRKSS